jgi:dephospho-CoA kinase
MQADKRPYLIGITGTIGSGKSTVGKLLEERGVPVIDSDNVVHELLNTPNTVQQSVVDRFGKEILKNGAVDRIELGKKVFNDARARKELESIIHPAVIMECRRRAYAHKDKPVVAILAPLLFEAGLGSEYDEVWTVYASQAVLHERIKQRDRLSDNDIEKRIAAQWPQDRKAELAKHVINNSGSEEETRKQVGTLIDKLLAAHKQ